MGGILMLVVVSTWSWGFMPPDVEVNGGFHMSDPSKWAWEWPGPEGGVPAKLAVQPDNPSQVMAMTDFSLWTYNGYSWQLEDELQMLPIDVVALGGDAFGAFLSSPDIPNAVGFHRKVGNGSWTMVKEFIGFLGVGEAAGAVNYVVTVDSIYKTTDGGQTWTALTSSSTVFDTALLRKIDLDFSPAHPDTVYLALQYEDLNDAPYIVLVKSMDGGASWDTVYVDHGTADFPAALGEIEVKPDDPDFVVITNGFDYGPGMMKYSTDGGHTFNVWFSTLAQALVFTQDVEFIGDTVYISNTFPSKLVRGVKLFGVWTFEVLDTIRMFGDIDISGNTVYAAYSAGIARSTNGTDFDDISDDFKAVEHVGYLFGPTFAFYFPQHGQMTAGYMVMNDLPFYVTNENGLAKFSNAIYITRDGGLTWEKKYLPSGLVFNAINAPNNPDYIYISAIGVVMVPPDSFQLYGLYRSMDGGNTFEPLQALQDTGEITPIGVHWISPSNPDVLIASNLGFQKGAELKRSVDGGHTFTTVFSTNDNPVALTGTDTLFFAHTNYVSSTIEVSYDAGANWSTFTTIQGVVTDAKYNPANHRLYVMCVGTSGPEIRTYSLDGSYESIAPPMVAANPLNLSVDDRGRMFLGLITSDYMGILARWNGSNWEVDSMIPVPISEILATDSAVTAFTMAFSTIRSRDAAFYVQEPVVPIAPPITPQVFYEDGQLKFTFSASAEVPVDIRVFDVSGRELLHRRVMTRGTGVVSLDLPFKPGSGVYLYRVSQGTKKTSGKFVVIR